MSYNHNLAKVYDVEEQEFLLDQSLHEVDSSRQWAPESFPVSMDRAHLQADRRSDISTVGQATSYQPTYRRSPESPSSQFDIDQFERCQFVEFQFDPLQHEITQIDDYKSNLDQPHALSHFSKLNSRPETAIPNRSASMVESDTLPGKSLPSSAGKKRSSSGSGVIKYVFLIADDSYDSILTSYPRPKRRNRHAIPNPIEPSRIGSTRHLPPGEKNLVNTASAINEIDQSCDDAEARTVDNTAYAKYVSKYSGDAQRLSAAEYLNDHLRKELGMQDSFEPRRDYSERWTLRDEAIEYRAVHLDNQRLRSLLPDDDNKLPADPSGNQNTASAAEEESSKPKKHERIKAERTRLKAERTRLKAERNRIESEPAREYRKLLQENEELNRALRRNASPKLSTPSILREYQRSSQKLSKRNSELKNLRARIGPLADQTSFDYQPENHPRANPEEYTEDNVDVDIPDFGHDFPDFTFDEDFTL
ncbi:uncharacterized protein IL334_007592 [Kwoniella shivajii]|uniref:BZIP domain-containing protein n=1 Tax=Kwoniella shivajii TaxID=564305 RepID=A0ABZ1DBC2_9TREE|nr:hypothetical protein IL334_007592 [Kwoniella shivajii]